MTSLSLLRRRVRQAVLGRRRLLAAILAAVAVAAGLRSVAPPPPATTTVLTAARDLPSGTVLTAEDLTETAFSTDSVPSGVLPAPGLLGRTTAAPLRSGEPITDLRIVRGSLLDGYPGMVAAPVRIGDPDAVSLLRVGDRIDLLAAAAQSPNAVVAASDVEVIAIPKATEGALLVVALHPEAARRVAELGVSSFISVVIRR